MALLLKWLTLVGLACLSQAEPVPTDREGRLLLDTTTTSTVTVATISYCYTTAAAVSACTRKKRALIDEKPVEFEDMDEFHRIVGAAPGSISAVADAPSSADELNVDLNEAKSEIAVAPEANTGVNHRYGRSYYYLYTTTSYTSSFSYSTTTTVTFSCTPSTSILALCG